MLAKSTKIFSEISFIIKKRKLSNFIFYSYWLHSTAITAVRLQRKFGGAAISRVHGIDLYEERSGGYLPYRKFLFENLDAIYPDCIKGQKYMQQKYPLYKDMFTLKYLGSNDHSVAAFERQRDRLNIVSCSNVIPIKRIQLLARALATVDFPVKWIHFGSGSALESLSEEVALLPENISATLAGFTPNSDVLKYYKMHNADVFVHCSETEGMCVSITEANSFGIPIIAADAGGVCEQVFTGKNGFLLPNDFKIEELAEKLSYFFNASDEEIAALRKGAREVWETSFQAEKNFTEFNNMLLNWEDAPRRS
ncbi:MAG: glycosyltransferase [Oscillospiraceae bacterium]|nr:glycosyltransferase [Oscillospiraceae bacterium]